MKHIIPTTAAENNWRARADAVASFRGRGQGHDTNERTNEREGTEEGAKGGGEENGYRFARFASHLFSSGMLA